MHRGTRVDVSECGVECRHTTAICDYRSSSILGCHILSTPLYHTLSVVFFPVVLAIYPEQSLSILSISTPGWYRSSSSDHRVPARASGRPGAPVGPTAAPGSSEKSSDNSVHWQMLPSHLSLTRTGQRQPAVRTATERRRHRTKSRPRPPRRCFRLLSASIPMPPSGEAQT